jgi:hypothetical protein
MLNKKESDNAARASIKKEMAKPRVAKSVRMAELNFAADEVRGQARTKLTGTVEKIIASLRPAQPGTAQIAVAGADDRYRILRIENSLTDGNGDEVKLKNGAHVAVTVTAKPKK